ncbi:unnamed protein product [Chrysoparadoxa australica]
MEESIPLLFPPPSSLPLFLSSTPLYGTMEAPPVASATNPVTTGVALTSGGIAGTCVDVALYPLDTIKTRLQSSRGFLKAGGFRGVYSGLSAAALGSAPGAALFFRLAFQQPTYSPCNCLLRYVEGVIQAGHLALVDSQFCLFHSSVRVPTENVKQKMQAGLHSTMTSTIAAVVKSDGLAGFYVGFLATVMREIPFSIVQFPLYEKAKCFWSERLGRPLATHESAFCGSLSGSIAAGVTTPFDVVKTRLMLGSGGDGERQYRGMVHAFQQVHHG